MTSVLAQLTDDEIDRLAQRFFEQHSVCHELTATGTARRATVYTFLRWVREDEDFARLIESTEQRP